MAATHAPRPSLAQSKLIDDLGGPTKVARTVSRHIGKKCTPQMVSNWRRRGIPFCYRARLALEARELRIGVPDGFLNEGDMTACRPVDEDVPGFLQDQA